MISFIRENPGEATSQVLAEQFLHFKSPNPQLAHRAVEAILDRDRRCQFSDQGTWEATQVEIGGKGERLGEMPMLAVHLLEHTVGKTSEVYHVSAWTIHPELTCVLSEWLCDPRRLSSEDKSYLVMEDDAGYERKSRNQILSELGTLLDHYLPVYLTRRQQSLLWRLYLLEGETCNDDGITLHELFRLGEIDRPRPLTLQKSYAILFGSEPTTTDPGQGGKLLGECTKETLARLRQVGIETRTDMEAREKAEIDTISLEGKKFSRDDLYALPEKPGVYAFTGTDGIYIYIGKSSNLKRRVTGYFRTSDESPGKLEQLRQQAHAMTIAVCGSELEALIFEYRLIKKHAPLLNSQKTIQERKGEYREVPDSIILLPHAEEGKAMSFWFRAGQKTTIRPFDPSSIDQPDLAQSLQTFFLSPKLPADQSDFPEQEIAARWVLRHRDSLISIPTASYTTGQEMLEAMVSYWKEMGHCIG